VIDRGHSGLDRESTLVQSWTATLISGVLERLAKLPRGGDHLLIQSLAAWSRELGALRL